MDASEENVEILTDPVEIQRIRDLWAEIQANPAEPDDVDALLAKLAPRPGDEDDKEIGIRP